jgi:heat shock protein HslJ
MRALAFLILMVCATAAQAQVEGKRFVLTALDGIALPAEDGVTIAFQAPAANGFGGCNGYAARFSERLVLKKVRISRPGVRPVRTRTVRTWTIRIRDISATRKFCGPQSRIESLYFAALERARRYDLAGGRLRLFAARGTAPVLTFALR